MKPYSKIILCIMLLTIAVFGICLFGCTKYNQIRDLHTKGITTYDTSRVVSKIDSLEYPYWQKITITNYEDSLEINTYFLVHWVARGKADSNIYLGKDTLKLRRKEK